MLNLAVVIDCIPSADQALTFLGDYLYISAWATILLLVWFAVGEVIDRFWPHFGEYRESNVVDLHERKQQLGDAAYRRAR